MRCAVRFTGRVQGVGFRATAGSIAAGYRVTGWVRNEPDGSVVAEVQGDTDEVAHYLGAVQAAMRSNIRSMDSHDVPSQPFEADFVIRR